MAVWLKIGQECINLDITTKLIELDGKKRIVAYGGGGALVLYQGTDEADAKEQFDLLMKELGAVNKDRFKMERMIS